MDVVWFKLYTTLGNRNILLSVLETLESNYTIKIERDLQYNGDETLDEAYRKSCRNTDDIDLINNFGGNKNGK